VNDDEFLPGPTYEQRRNQQLRREIEEADQEWIRKQKLLDHLWQQKLDSESDWDDDYIEIGGFRERRSAMPSFHKSRRDRDWGLR
jgi:hypothetical protein